MYAYSRTWEPHVTAVRGAHGQCTVWWRFLLKTCIDDLTNLTNLTKLSTYLDMTN